MSNRIEIIPAILPATFAELEDKASLVKGIARTIQVDVCDGHLVPSFTWPYKKADDSFNKIIREEEGLPFWQDFDYEFDLMVDKPEDIVDEWVTAGASRIIIHVEAKGNAGLAVEKLQGRVQVGLALNVGTPLEIVQDPKFKIQEGEVQFLQLMGIDHVGFQGQAFDDKVIGKIKAARLMFPGLPVSIDGGVSLENAPQLIAAGADRLVVGSAIFESDNLVEAIRRFKAL